MSEVVLLRADAARLPLPPGAVDAVVTDPPYGLADLKPKVVIKALAEWLAGARSFVPDGRGFMSTRWDRFVPPPAAWDECYRVLKPGGCLLAFAAPRTADLMGLSIRLAGFEIRDSPALGLRPGVPEVAGRVQGHRQGSRS
jgi:site-specific DNA-methyltransferase (adenine-specific)